MKVQDFQDNVTCGGFDNIFANIYKPQDIESQKSRYMSAVEKFTALYPNRNDIHVYSAPGRTEIGGNHTDHQHGCVIAGAVDLDVIGVAAFHDENIIRIKSEGYDEFAVSLDDLDVHIGEKGSSEIVRGIAARFKDFGVEISGFDMYTTSNVLGGSGISSSAAFETLIATAIDSYYNHNQIGAVEIAKIGQAAENEYFGKPCGLMDQTASSVGDAVAIDFKDPANPIVRSINADLTGLGLALCIIDCGADHAALTNEYASIPEEMSKVAAHFGKKVLREVKEEDLLADLAQVRKEAGDRAVLRALHFYADDRRAAEEADALERKDKEAFLNLVKESGRSSWELLQNITPAAAITHQDMAVALAVAEKALNGKGACRVHGGGFAGTIQAFVPVEDVCEFKKTMETMLSEGCCHVLSIRPAGGLIL